MALAERIPISPKCHFPGLEEWRLAEQDPR